MPSKTHEILEQHPQSSKGSGTASLADCIAACNECAAVCTTCADACVAEARPGLEVCIRLNLDCADICAATARVLSRSSGSQADMARLLSACRAACMACGTECDKHALHMKHCATCAECCRRCADACANLLNGGVA